MPSRLPAPGLWFRRRADRSGILPHVRRSLSRSCARLRPALRTKLQIRRCQLLYLWRSDQAVVLTLIPLPRWLLTSATDSLAGQNRVAVSGHAVRALIERDDVPALVGLVEVPGLMAILDRSYGKCGVCIWVYVNYCLRKDVAAAVRPPAPASVWGQPALWDGCAEGKTSEPWDHVGPGTRLELFEQSQTKFAVGAQRRLELPDCRVD